MHCSRLKSQTQHEKNTQTPWGGELPGQLGCIPALSLLVLPQAQLWTALEMPESGNTSCLLFTHFTIHGNYSTLTSDKFLGNYVVQAMSLPYTILTTGNGR